VIVDRYELGQIGTNCYVVRRERGAAEAVVVDPGDAAAQLRLELATMRASCAGILVTHSHWDHIGGVADLAEATGAPVSMSALEAPVLESPDEWYGSYGIRVRAWTPEVRLEGGEEFELGGLAWRTLFVPGHSPGHLAFVVEDAVFSGDVLFSGGVGRVDLPGGDWDTLLASVRALADELPPETTVYSGHGPATTLGHELATNPFLAELRAAS
jgi:glyoxylase-like metal-dependent hydrolase (beta-lactamase superfamily II)